MPPPVALCLDPLDERLAPARIGAPDLLFASGSRAYLAAGRSASFFATDDLGRAGTLAVQADGRVLAVGDASANDPLAVPLSRTLANGQRDAAFGSFGTARVPFDGANVGTARAVGLAAEPGLRTTVVAAVGPANAAPDRLAFAQVNPLGVAEITYGDGGRRLVALPAGYTSSFLQAAATAVPGGGVVVAIPLLPVPDPPALTPIPGPGTRPPAVGVVKISAAGAVDTSFGTGGWAVVTAGTGAVAGIAVGPDGSVVVGTIVRPSAAADFAALKLTPAGRLDTTFGTGGVATVPFDLANSAGDDLPFAVAVQPDGKVLLVGSVASQGLDTDIGVARLLADGRPDPSFGPAGDGRLVAAFDLGGANNDRATAVAVQPDGRVLVAGDVELPQPVAVLPPGAVPEAPRRASVVTLRYRADGSLDPEFNGTGSRVEPLAAGYGYRYNSYYPDQSIFAYYPTERAASVAVQPNGRVLVGVTAASVNYSKSFYYDYTQGRYVEQRSGTFDTSAQVIGLVGRIGVPAGLAVSGPASGAAVGLTAGPNGTYQPGDATTPLADQVPGAVRVARADYDGDGVEDVAYAAGPGAPPTVRVVSGRTGQDLAAPFRAFEDSFLGGLFLAAGDFDGDGRAELVVTPDRGGGPRVRVLSLAGGLPQPMADFFGIADPAFRGGARAAVGDVNADGTPDLVVGAGFGGGPRVALFDGRSVRAGAADPTRLTGDFLAFPGADAARLRDGVYVAAGDLTGDGYAEVVVGGGPGGAPRVLVLDGPLLLAGGADTAGAAPVANFFAGGDSLSRGGARVAVRDLDGDNRADLAVGTGAGQPGRVWLYRAGSVVGVGSPAADGEFLPFGGEALADGIFVG